MFNRQFDPLQLIVVIVVFLLIPDQAQPRVFNEQFAPNLKDNATIVIASGYNVFFKLLNFKPSQDVVMVAPRYVSRNARAGRGLT